MIKSSKKNKMFNFFSTKYLTQATTQSPGMMVLFSQSKNPSRKRTQAIIVELLCQIAQGNYLTQFYKIGLKKAEAVIQSCFGKKMFLKVLQNSQENTCTRVSFLIRLQALKIS